PLPTLFPYTTLFRSRYVTGILNSSTLVERVRPLQAVGLFGARHFDKYVFSVPFGRYDRSDDKHLKLVSLVAQAEEVAQSVDISGDRKSTRLNSSHVS